VEKIFLVLICMYFYSLNVFSQITVVEDSLYSPSINGMSKFYAVLPDGYSKTQERYTTVYLLHGFNQNYTDWVKLTDLISYLKGYRYIVITPDGKNRWYSNSVVMQNSNFEDFLVKDVIPYVDKNYRTKPSKYSRAIAGISMGGYGAAKFGLKYPGLFFFSGCLSPAIQFPNGMEDSSIVSRRSKESNQSLRDVFGEKRNDSWQNNDVFALAEKANAKTLPYFYLAVGSQDGIPEIIDLTHSFSAALRRKNTPFEMHETTGGHDWKFWDKEIEIVLHRISEISGKKQ
jgi:putative tributyrin esterase